MEPPKTIDGISFVPTLLGGPQPSHEYLFWSYGEKKAVRKGCWKAVVLGKNKPLELYYLSKDIGEENNIAEEHPEIVAEMKKIIAEAS